MATNGKTYLIKRTGDANGLNAQYITIMTDTSWGSATIIIDDTDVMPVSGTAPEYKTNIFVVKSPYANITLKGDEIAAYKDGFSRDITKFDLGLGYQAMLVVYNKNHKNYIRYGGNANSGSSQKELIVVDAEGNIDPSTQFMLDYEEVTSVTVVRCDLEPITISGGNIITKAPEVNLSTKDPVTGKWTDKMCYYSRGLSVQRSNTTLKNIVHLVEGEKDYVAGSASEQRYTGPSHSGFFSASTANNVLIEGCTMTARKYYRVAGTYDFGAAMVNNIYLKDCDQSNFYKEDGTTPSMQGSEYWGVGGTNYCKNMVYDGCELTRYDAHSGVYNGKIINSKVTSVNLIGGGEMLIKDSIIETTNSTIVGLRTDYGATFDGKIIFDNVTIRNTRSDYNLLAGNWANHYFGYQTHLPDVEVISLNFGGKNVTVNIFSSSLCGDDILADQAPVVDGSGQASGEMGPNVNKMDPPKSIIIKDTTSTTAYYLKNSNVFLNTQLEGKITRN